MRIEHVALNVEDPVKMAAWLVDNLGMRIARRLDDPAHTHFLADAAGRSMLEIYRAPGVALPDYRKIDPLVLHVAFAVEDVGITRQELIQAGATAAGEITNTPAGDVLAMLRDPWGLPIQLLRRARPMLKD